MGKGTDKMAENGFSVTEDLDPAFADDQEDFPKEGGEDLKESEENIQGSHHFMELYEESLKSIQEGKIVKGQILQVDKEYVLVDIGYKSEGIIRIAEFIDSDGHLTATVGDEVDVLLVRKEGKDGRIILSKEKAAGAKLWNDIEEAYRSEGTVRGKIISKVKGGLYVDIGLQAFLPGSLADLPPVKDLDPLIGTEHDFRIIKYERQQGNIVLSRRAVLEAERMTQREDTLESLEEGAVIGGTVTNITDYGLFIDLGGIDGLVHVTNMSWGRVGHPSEIYQIGDTITVKILSFDRERERVSLGIKQLTPDPWADAQNKYPVGTKIAGRIAGLKKYGAFVELEEGVEGLVHMSEMSWTRKILHPSEILSVGNIVETVVLSLDVAKRRISLSVKQLEPNPWDIIAENYPQGAIIEGKIKNITEFGIFIGIDEGIDGLVHISDISWTKQINHPSELYKKGEVVQAVILHIDKENERFSLGIKQLTPDPWNEIPEKYKPGTRVSGRVTNVTDFGLFIELEEGIEGLIHVSQLPKAKQSIKGFQVNDEIQAEVVNVSQKDKRIGLSIRKLEESSERDIHKSYVNSQKQATSSLGELLKEKMMNLQPQAALENQKSELSEAVESESDTEIETADSSSEKPKSEEINSA
jgi:small subunit ribosomal protein S1